jgi:hypothetical protein
LILPLQSGSSGIVQSSQHASGSSPCCSGFAALFSFYSLIQCKKDAQELGQIFLAHGLLTQIAQHLVSL